MILLFNILITPSNLAHTYNRGGLPSDDKLEVFKYTLKSIAPIYDWSQVIINYVLDGPYANKYEETNAYIRGLFPNQPNFTLNSGGRCCRQKDWVYLLSHLVNDELIFFSCNHDHFFIDSQKDYFNQAVKEFAQHKNENATLYLSHYAETCLELSKNRQCQLNKYLVQTNIATYDSFLILTTKLFKDWWTRHDIGESFCPRSDYGSQSLGITLDAAGKTTSNPIFCAFSREVFRHYDGYMNVIYPQCSHFLKYFPALTIESAQKFCRTPEEIQEFLEFYVGKGTKEYDYFWGEHQKWLS